MAFLGAIGAAVGAGAATSVSAYVVGAAITGAVVGGVVAAVQGKNILKGALIGGAIGAFAGWGYAGFGAWGAEAGGLAKGGVGSLFGTTATTGGGTAGGTGIPALTSESARELALQKMGQEAANKAGTGLLGGLTGGEKMIALSGVGQGIGNIMQANAQKEAAQKAEQQYNQERADLKAAAETAYATPVKEAAGTINVTPAATSTQAQLDRLTQATTAGAIDPMLPYRNIAAAPTTQGGLLNAQTVR